MLRDYQLAVKHQILSAFNDGHRRVLAVMPTGAGKTVVMADILSGIDGYSIAIAHRQELVSQISLAMAREGIVHRIIAPVNVIKSIIHLHVKKYGRSYHNLNARSFVAGVDTLIRREYDWFHKISLWEIDEGHHVLPTNKWGRAVALFPNARGIGWTATPCRSDKKSLNVTYQKMIVGPSMGELINQGYLSKYKVYGPPQSINLDDVKITRRGDYSDTDLTVASHKSTITGDIVKHYLRIAPGKRGVTFVVDVETSKQVADAYVNAGVPAASIDARTDIMERSRQIDRLERGELLQLVNVDIFGEGFDLPAIEVVSLGRPTASLGLHRQQIGRVLRPCNGKFHGTIIDHVGNVGRHGLPDTDMVWSIDTPEPQRRPGAGGGGVKFCVECYNAMENFRRICPHCGAEIVSGGKGRPEQVDGDLTEYDDDTLDTLRRAAASVITSPNIGNPHVARAWDKRREAQNRLREIIALWAGHKRDILRLSDAESYRLFYHSFNVDVLTAQSLSAGDADRLTHSVREDLTNAT
ncbi:MAG: DEAD/DEAH box helicase [Candidatus Paceibacterota bacterium]|jgi:superfamily II DNA or RNA helicase